jgi:hypothetical protein
MTVSYARSVMVRRGLVRLAAFAAAGESLDCILPPHSLWYSFNLVTGLAVALWLRSRPFGMLTEWGHYVVSAVILFGILIYVPCWVLEGLTGSRLHWDLPGTWMVLYLPVMMMVLGYFWLIAVTEFHWPPNRRLNAR